MFKYTLDNKRYHTLNYDLTKRFNTRVFKVSLNGGFSCPNFKNGSGCIFCSLKGSGDFAGNKKDNLLTDNTSLVRYNKDKSEVDNINKLIEIYNKFISNINAGGNESVKVITNGNLYFIGVSGGNVVSNVYFNKDGYCEKLYNGLLSFNETYNSGVDTINGTNQAFESIALCAEPLYVGDSINPNVKEGECYAV